MARTWLSVKVELLGGRGVELWPWPGRVFAVGPSHTFMDLADAVNDAFARWDRSHLSVFTLADGRVVTDEETGAEMTGSIGGPVMEAIDITSAKVGRTVDPGAEFSFTFDLGDNWTHRCEVEEERIDPDQTLGIRPSRPLPYWGWGDIPDQYGRRWADDDGRSRAPRRPRRPHPMVTGEWPSRAQAPELDLTEVRAAIATHDADRLLDAVIGRDVGDVLQQVGVGLSMALEGRRTRAEPVVLSVINRLTWRGGVGDQVLADDLLARLRAEPPPGRLLPVSLDVLSDVVEGDASESTGGYVDLGSGEVYDETLADPAMVGDDAVIDVEEEPERWLWFERTGSREGWRDMADFAAAQRDPGLAERLQRAIEGRGAFRRFRDVVHDAGLAGQWHAFSTDRRFGRARDLLAGEGIRLP